MAKFIYRMQNILDIKYKLEESAKQEFADAIRALAMEEEKLEYLKERRQGYYVEYKRSITGKLDFLRIDESGNAIDIIDDMIVQQHEIIKERSRDVEKARIKLNSVMQERKMHEKLKDNKFEEFKQEINAEETKEIDQVVSYQYNDKNAEE